jgi:hypothetical protein
MVPYDYTPGAWNLSEGEILQFEWPGGPQRFLEHVSPDVIANFTFEMDVLYSEPFIVDRSQIAPGTVVINSSLRTITFTGPIDMWTWSKTQEDPYHQSLSDEWDRVGLLPRGAPWIEFNVANSSVPDLAPYADAGDDMIVLGGEIVSFDGSASFDDFGVVNWTWRFWYDGGWVELYGPEPVFTFWIEGVYEVNLTVSDSMSQTDWDVMTVTISGFIPEFGSVTFTVVALAAAVWIIFARLRIRRRDGE